MHYGVCGGKPLCYYLVLWREATLSLLFFMITFSFTYCLSSKLFIKTALAKLSNGRLRSVALCKTKPLCLPVVNLMHIQFLFHCIGSIQHFLLLICVSLAEYLPYSRYYDLLLQVRMDICMRCPLASIRVTLTSDAVSSLHSIACG